MFMFEIELHFLLFLKIISIETSVRVVDKGILPLERNSVAIQFYLDIENEDKGISCKLRSKPKMCCLSDDNKNIDCDIMDVFGDYADVLKPKYRDTILYIYPTMSQHDQVGYCHFMLDQRCGRKHVRETVKVPFDTRLKMNSNYLLKGYANGKKITNCETIDQDSLNQCTPVNCDVKYFGDRPYYDTDLNRCVKAVECLSNLKLELPDVVYVPKSNTCRDLNNPLTIADIYAISTGLGIIRESPEKEEVQLTLKSNCSTISQNLEFLRDMLYGKIFPMKLKTDFSKSCKVAIMTILTCIIGLSLALLLFVIFASTTACIHSKWKSGELKKNIHDLKKKMKGSQKKHCKKKASKINDEVKNRLLKEVIVSDLPLELRDSLVDICDRIGEEVRWKRRYRPGDVGSQVNLKEDDTCDTSTTSDPHE